MHKEAGEATGSSLLMIFFSAQGVALQFDLTDLLTRHIRTEFLALSVVLGYLLFLLLFHSRDKSLRWFWDSVEWAERFFVAFLLGMLIIFASSIGLDSLVSYLYQRILLEKPWDPVAIWIMSSLIVFIVVLLIRLEIAEPIHTQRVVEKFDALLAKARFLAVFFGLPICFLIILVTCAYSSLFLYTVTGNVLYHFWIGLFGAFFLFALFVPWLLLLTLAVVARFLSPIAIQAPSAVMRSAIAQGRRLVNLAKCPAQLVREAKCLWTQAVMKRTSVCILIIVILLGTLIPFGDAQIGLYAPRVEYVETQVEPMYAIVGHSIDDYSVVVGVTKTFFISSPRLWFIRNITIANPSNCSYFEDSQHPYWQTISYSLLGSGAALSALKGPGGRVAAFNITFQPPTDMYEVALATSYYDRIDYSLINKTVMGDIDVGNNTVRREIHLMIHNPFHKPLSLSPLQIMSGPQITRVTCEEDGELFSCTDTCDSKRCLYLVMWQPLHSGQSLNLTLTIEFTRQ